MGIIKSSLNHSQHEAQCVNPSIKFLQRKGDAVQIDDLDLYKNYRYKFNPATVNYGHPSGHWPDAAVRGICDHFKG